MASNKWCSKFASHIFVDLREFFSKGQKNPAPHLTPPIPHAFYPSLENPTLQWCLAPHRLFQFPQNRSIPSFEAPILHLFKSESMSKVGRRAVIGMLVWLWSDIDTIGIHTYTVFPWHARGRDDDDLQLAYLFCIIGSPYTLLICLTRRQIRSNRSNISLGFCISSYRVYGRCRRQGTDDHNNWGRWEQWHWEK